MFTRYVLPIVAVLGVIFAVVFVHGSNQIVPATQPVADPAQAPYASYVAGAGIVEASTENIAVGTLVPGVVSEIYKKIGDHVKAGEPLFKIDSRDSIAELAVRQAALESAKANQVALEAAAADAEREWQNVKLMGDVRAMSREDIDRRQFATQQAQAKVLQAKADVGSADAMMKATRTELDRRIVRALVDGTILQCKIHLGEYAQAGPLDPPLMLLGNTDVLNVRVDIDENDAWRMDTARPAMAFVRGNRDLSTPLHFVRVEPYVVPKKSLTGDSTERVDTRVLQGLYSFDPKSLPVYVGQQMDVFIEAQPIRPAAAYTPTPG
jgi:HlyD family secretion protein